MLGLSIHTHSLLDFIHHTVTCTKTCVFMWSDQDDLHGSRWTRDINY